MEVCMCCLVGFTGFTGLRLSLTASGIQQALLSCAQACWMVLFAMAEDDWQEVRRTMRPDKPV
eukprot:355342-Chlamydomonas_euryale.AAC.2